jgi:hypothetical protein
MSSFIGGSKARVARWSGQLWRINAPLTATAGLMLLALAGFSLGLVLDPRYVTGAPVWLKPAKFAASIATYCVTLTWLFGLIPSFARTRRFVGWGTLVAMLLGLGIIATQAARGTTSHFNVSTPLNARLYMVMGIVIGLQTLSTILVAVALFKQRFEDRALGWAARLGMTLAIVGALLGGVMTRPTEAQLPSIQAGRPERSGAHTVGAVDGEPGMPITGWSREHGDLRVPHFVALHALQVLPLLALGLRRTRRTSAQRVRLVLGFAASYTGLVGILFWQALRGQPLSSTDSSSLAALVVWLTLTAVMAWRSLVASSLPERAAVTVS